MWNPFRVFAFIWYVYYGISYSMIEYRSLLIIDLISLLATVSGLGSSPNENHIVMFVVKNLVPIYVCKLNSFHGIRTIYTDLISVIMHMLILDLSIDNSSHDIRWLLQMHMWAPQMHSIHIPSKLLYKSHQIPKLKCFSPRLAVVFAQSIEARCKVESENVVGAAPTGALHIRDSTVLSKYS